MNEKKKNYILKKWGNKPAGLIFAHGSFMCMDWCEERGPGWTMHQNNKLFSLTQWLFGGRCKVSHADQGKAILQSIPGVAPHSTQIPGFNLTRTDLMLFGLRLPEIE